MIGMTALALMMGAVTGAPSVADTACVVMEPVAGRLSPPGFALIPTERPHGQDVFWATVVSGTHHDWWQGGSLWQIVADGRR